MPDATTDPTLPGDGAGDEITATVAVDPDAAAEQAVASVPDDVLLASVNLAREALLEITPSSTVGKPAGYFVEDEHVLSLLFECTLPGYPGWNWTVTISRIDDESTPSVLEAELMPGDRALLAPDWVPWSERLADYQASQEALRAVEAGDGEQDEDADDYDDEESDDDFDDESDEADDDDESDDEDDDDDDDDVHALHAGDIDGVDIESADASYDEDTDDDLELDLPAEEAAALEDDESGEESASLDAEVDEPDESENESDDDRPEPPAVAGVSELAAEDEHDDEGDHPQA
jgi:hypothetical protein